MREPNFITPKRWPRPTVSPACDAADDAPRQDADDLAEDDRRAVVIDPDLGPLVDARRSRAGRRAGTAPAGRSTLVTRARHRRAVDVHVDRRQEDADLLPVTRRARRLGLGRRRPSRGHRPATRTRRRVVADVAIGIAEEEQHERREDERRYGPDAAPERRMQSGRGRGRRR